MGVGEGVLVRVGVGVGVPVGGCVPVGGGVVVGVTVPPFFVTTIVVPLLSPSGSWFADAL
jgi:hypothetical protein